MQNNPETDVVQILKDLIATPSFCDPEDPSKNENAVVEYLENWVKKHTKFSTQRQELAGGRYNLIVKSGEPQTIFLAHTDTVPLSVHSQFNQLEAVELEGEIWGRGATDMKSGIASLLVMLLHPAAHTKNFWMIFYADEEYHFLGMQRFVNEYSQLRPSLLVSADGSDLELGSGCRGLIEVVVRVKGEPGHPGKGTGKSANRAVLHSLTALEEFVGQYSHPVMGDSLLNIAYLMGGATLTDSYQDSQLIKVGKQANIVPDICEAVLEVRPAQAELTGQTIAQFLRAEYERLGVELENLELRHDLGAMYVDPTEVSFYEKLQENGFKKFSDVRKSGYLDLQMAWSALGRPAAIMFGSGFGATNHGPNERISITNLRRANDFFTTIIENIE